MLILMVESPDRLQVHRALKQGIARLEWWRFWGRSQFELKETGSPWICAWLDPSTRSPGSLAEQVSGILSVRTLLLARNTVAGSEEIQYCVRGESVRWLWYGIGEDYAYADEGDPLDFEAGVTAKRRRDAEQQLSAMSEEERSREQWRLNKGCLFPQSEDFSRALGCPPLDQFFSR